MSVADQQYSVLLPISPWSQPSTVWTTTKTTVVLPHFLLLDGLDLVSFSPFLSCFFLSFLLMYGLLCSFWKDSAKAHQSTIFFFIFSLLPFYLRLKQSWPLKIPTDALPQSPGFLITVSIRPSHLDFSPTETRTWRSWCVSLTPIWRVDVVGVCDLRCGNLKWVRVHNSDIAWGALNCDFNRRNCCQQTASPRVIVVLWFGVLLCYCTVVIVSLRTSHVN